LNKESWRVGSGKWSENQWEIVSDWWTKHQERYNFAWWRCGQKEHEADLAQPNRGSKCL